MRPGGFEPPTNSLEGCCSIHLSYGRAAPPNSTKTNAPLPRCGGRPREGGAPYGVRRCTTLTTKAPLSGRDRARVSGKRNRASGSVVYPEFHTKKTSSPITGIQWNRTLKSTRSFSLSYCTKASKLVRVLKSYSNRLADRDRKSTRLNSSHGYISYAVFCLKKKKHANIATPIELGGGSC